MFSFSSLPAELQVAIFRCCDSETLATLSIVSTGTFALANPLLWHSINFDAFKEEYGPQELLKIQGQFFIVCQRLRAERPERWKTLAVYVRVLRLMRTEGVRIPDGADHLQHNMLDQLWILSYHAGKNFLKVIADLTMLEELHIYLKDSGDIEHQVTVAEDLLDLKNLRILEIGGNVSREVMLALLAAPENICELSCIHLLDGEGGQELHDGGLLFWGEVETDRFTHLTKLHLCKLGELTDDLNVTGMPWSFDHENDRAILGEWAVLLEMVSSTIIYLVLEDRYLANLRLSEPEEWPSEWGAASNQRFQEVLLPTINELTWPYLRQLTLRGFEGDTQIAEVKVKRLRGMFSTFNYDVTPMTISPRDSFSLDL